MIVTGGQVREGGRQMASKARRKQPGWAVLLVLAALVATLAWAAARARQRHSKAAAGGEPDAKSAADGSAEPDDGEIELEAVAHKQ
jgi:hypothetical protein